ncbi:MAG: ABC transporter ATP-binding protein, partial [Gaiellaceae bacterium]
MRIYQPGGHLTDRRGAEVDDWSWARTARRIGVLTRLARPYRARTALAVISLLAAVATSLAPPFLAKIAIDEGIGDKDLELLGWIVGAFLFAGLLNWGAGVAQTYYWGWVGERILADLRNRLFAHLQRLSLGFYERNRTGAIISRLTNDVDALDRLVTEGVTSLLQNTLTLFGSAVILFFLDWRLALATLAVFPLMSIATAIFRRRSSRAYRRVRERLGQVTAALQEDISGMRVVHSFTREERNAEQFRQVNDNYRAANQETVILNGLYFPFVDFLSSAATSVVLGFGGYLIFDGSLTVGTLFAFIGYLSNFFDPVQQLSQLYNT